MSKKSTVKASTKTTKKPVSKVRAPRPSEYYKRLTRWAEALESGEYKQAHNKLRDADGLCCLGVACDVSNLGSWGRTTYGVGKKKRADLPVVAVRDYYGFTTPGGADIVEKAKYIGKMISLPDTSLDALNDHYGYTFKKIAKVIHKYAELTYGPNRIKE